MRKINFEMYYYTQRNNNVVTTRHCVLVFIIHINLCLGSNISISQGGGEGESNKWTNGIKAELFILFAYKQSQVFLCPSQRQSALGTPEIETLTIRLMQVQ